MPSGITSALIARSLTTENHRLPNHRRQAWPHSSRQIFRTWSELQVSHRLRPRSAALFAVGESFAQREFPNMISPAEFAASRLKWSRVRIPDIRFPPMRKSSSKARPVPGRVSPEGPFGEWMGYCTYDNVVPRPYLECQNGDVPQQSRSSPARRNINRWTVSRLAQRHYRRGGNLECAWKRAGCRRFSAFEITEGAPGDSFYGDPDSPALSRSCSQRAARRSQLHGRRLQWQIDGGGR